MDILDGHISKLAQSLESAPTLAISFFGFGLCRKWSSWAMASALASSPHSAALTTTIDLVGMLALLAVALVASRMKPLCRNGWLVAIAVVTLIAGTLLLGWAAPHGALALAVIGGVAAAVGRSVFWLAWFELFGCLPPARIAFAYAGSIVLCTVLWPALRDLSGGSLTFFVILIPLVSFAMLCSAWFKIADVHAPAAADLKDMTGPFWKLAAWVAAAGLCFGLATSGAVAQGWIEYAGRLVPNLLVILGMLFAGTRFDIDRVYQLAVPTIITGMLLCLTQLRGSGLDSFVISLGEECANIVFFVVACGLGYRRGVSAATLCGMLFFIRSFVVFGGGRIGSYLPTDTLPIACGIALVLFLLCSLLLFRNSDLLEMWDITGMNIGSAQEGNDLVQRIADVSQEYGLSEREQAVLVCMEKGLRNDEIASELFVAPGTVRAHMSRIYSKLGVHSRSEVDKVINA